MKGSKGMMIKCAILGGIVLMLWGMFSWTVLPWHFSTMQRFANEGKVMETVMGNTSGSGIYAAPNMHFDKEGMSKSEQKAMMDKEMSMKKTGPMMLLFLRTEGMTKGFLAKSIIVGFIIQAIAALLATWLLLHTKGLSYWKQVCFITTLGLFVGVVAELSLWNWWSFPICSAIVFMLDYIIGWFLAGLVIAKLIKK